MPQGKTWTLSVESDGTTATLTGIDTTDFTHGVGASTQTSVVRDDVIQTATDRYKVKVAYPSTALPATSLTIANLTNTALAAIQALNGATVPGAPTIGTASVASPTSASVAFTAPASNGGSAITGYTVTSSPGNITATGASSPIVVTGLTEDQAYTFTVTATNLIGTSAASAASNSVTPT